MGKIIFGTATSAKPNNTEVKQFQKGNAVRLIWAHRELSEDFGNKKGLSKKYKQGRIS